MLLEVSRGLENDGGSLWAAVVLAEAGLKRDHLHTAPARVALSGTSTNATRSNSKTRDWIVQ
jgi:hypothetical protein